MPERTVQAEQLLNTRIRDRHGKVIGALEEIVAEQDGDAVYVQEYHTGGLGFVEHLSAAVLGGWLYRLLEKRAKSYVIRWDQLDISHPERPVLTVPVSELVRK